MDVHSVGPAGEGDAHPDVDEMQRAPLAAAGARLLREQWRRALACESGVRAGDDPEAVHKMRVALRRFRAAAGVFGTALDRAAAQPVTEQMAEAAAAVARTLGRVRDLDVFIAYLQREAETASAAETVALQRLVSQRRAEQAAAGELARGALDGPEMQRLRETVVPCLDQIVDQVAMGMGQWNGTRWMVGRRAPKLVGGRLRRIRRLGETLFAPRSEDLHRVRIAAKKLRYTAEFFTPAFPEALPPLAQLATQIQDALGEAHDLDVFGATLLGDVERVAQDPAHAPEAAAIARLIGRTHEQREAALARFRTLWVALPTPGALRKQMARRTNATQMKADETR